MSRPIFVLLLLIIGLNLNGICQNDRLKLQSKREVVKIDTSFWALKFPSHDSLWHITMNTIEIVEPYRFKNKREERRYSQLEIDVAKAYPLALIVGSELKLVNSELDSIYTDKAGRKKYLKWYQDYVYRTYIDSLKSLSLQQGKLLLKLIHRETGKTPYDLIKSYRGGLNALFWQTSAFLFGANLNSSYDPVDDAMIEHIIRRIKAGDLPIERY